MVVNIGYPIGITETNKGSCYMLETKNQYVYLSYDELQAWANMEVDYLPTTESDLKMIQRLSTVGALAYAETKRDLYMMLLSHCYVRQGFGMINPVGECVHLKNDVTNLTKRQMTFWQLGNGSNSIDTVVAFMAAKNIVSKEKWSDIVDDLMFLIDQELIYII